MPVAPPGVQTSGDFVVCDGVDLAGISIFSRNGILSGVEATGIAGDAPKILSATGQLMTHEQYSRNFPGQAWAHAMYHLTPRSRGRVMDKAPSSSVGARAAQVNR